MSNSDFEPKVICFLCTWWAYAAADLAGVSRMQYPSNIRIVRVMCSGSVSPHHILRAFQEGVDGVFVGGWRLGDCNYLYGNYSAKKRVRFLRPLLKFSGIEEDRLRARWVSSAEAPEFVEEIEDFIKALRAMGPSPLKKEPVESSMLSVATGWTKKNKGNQGKKWLKR